MIRIRQLKVKEEKKTALIKKITAVLSISTDQIKSIQIRKKSLDARKKDQIHYVYEVDVDAVNEKKILKAKTTKKDIFLAPIEVYHFPEIDPQKDKKHPIIVGSGPAGLFCAYVLAEHGYNPIIIEQGEEIEKRKKTVEEFWKSGKLNLNSNVQFGEGGAGTFSDGKLNTMIKDKEYRGRKAFEILVENGAPEEIMYQNKPHIGTDLLQNIIKNIRNKIKKMGGKFYYNTKLTNIIIKKGKIVAIEVNHNQKISCDILVLAIGHSARDTFCLLYEKNVSLSSKPFAIGLRIEHPQEMINKSQYGEKYAPTLPPASYKLTYTTKEKRGVYSFCMCPGGYVVNASSEEYALAINGMSNHKRDSNNANSAIVVTVTAKDFGDHPLDGLSFQRKLEHIAYHKGQGKIPLQKYQDFLDNKVSTSLGEVTPCVKGGYTFANLNDILPSYITEAIKDAMETFDKKIKGFARRDALLLGIESRTSSPIRIERNNQGVSNIKGLYPCGEGAGYAGGITSSAIDGIKTAEWIAKNSIQPMEMKTFQRNQKGDRQKY